MGVISFWFGFWFVVLLFAIPVPETRDEVPENFSAQLNF
jgi:hypothetical protein